MLDKYYAVNVILTHDGVNFPKNDANDLAARAMIARNNNADLYVSLHIDNVSNYNISGADVYVTSRTELPKYKEQMTLLGNKILNNLSQIGIKNNGVINYKLCNDREPKYQYYDGSQADYYADIRHAMRGDTIDDLGSDFRDGSGIPTVLIEHCHMNNSHDVQYLQTDDRLKKLAKADADAIAEFLQLKFPEEVIKPEIKFEKKSDNILVGKSKKLDVQIMPGWEKSKTIIWKSSNTSIVEVQDTGIITAKKEGTAEVIATWKEKNLSCKMTINVLGLPEDSKIEIKNYKVENNKISKIGQKVSLEEFASNIVLSDNLAFEIKVANKNQKYIGTNTKLIIKEKEHNTELEEYECLIYADINGDGKISSLDYTLIKNHIMEVQEITNGNMKLTADVNGDGKISSLDYTLIKNDIMDVQKIALK